MRLHLCSEYVRVCVRLAASAVSYQSKALVAALLQAREFCAVSLELVRKTLLDVLEVLPGALWSDFEATVWISGPALESPVEEVVRVCIMDLLYPVVTRAVKPALALESLRPAAALIVVGENMETRIDRDEEEESHQWHRHVVLGHLADGQIPLEAPGEYV